MYKAEQAVPEKGEQIMGDYNRGRRLANNAVFQVSILDALMQGVMEGCMTTGELLSHGNFGIGTFEGLGGELLVLDGKAYCGEADGTVRPVGEDELISFAQVTFFDEYAPLHTMDAVDSVSDLKKALGAWTVEDPNIIYAVKGRVEEAKVTVRSIEKQEEPYPSLAEAAKHQETHVYENVSGTLIGFQFPRFMDGVNMPSWHFHFLSDDRTMGGHVLNMEAPAVVLKVYPIYEHTVRLPESRAFARLDIDQSEERKKALLKAEE